MRVAGLIVLTLFAGCFGPNERSAPEAVSPDEDMVLAASQSPGDPPASRLEFIGCSWWTVEWYADGQEAQRFVPDGYVVREVLVGNTVFNLVVVECEEGSVNGIRSGSFRLAVPHVVLDAAAGQEDGEWNDFFAWEAVVDGPAPVLGWFKDSGFNASSGTIRVGDERLEVRSGTTGATITIAPSHGATTAAFARPPFRLHAFNGEPHWMDDGAEFTRAVGHPGVIELAGGVFEQVSGPRSQGIVLVSKTDSVWTAGPELEPK